MRILKKIIKLQLSTDLTYRTQLLSWVLADSINFVIMAFVWSNVLSDQREYIFSYYLLGLLVLKVTKDWSFIYVSDSIIKGEYSNVLMKPLNPLFNYLGINIGSQLLRVLVILPILIILYLMLSSSLVYSIDILTVFLFLISLILGFLINFLLGNMFALIAVWVKQVHGLRILYSNLLDITSGFIIPYIFLPSTVNAILNVLPFKYIFHIPVNILVNGYSVNTLRDVFLGFIWLLLLSNRQRP